MAFVITRGDGTRYQVVDAATRGDKCYDGKTGYYWHNLDADNAIDELSIAGPFPDYVTAHANADACAYCNDTGWFYGDKELGRCGCGIEPKEVR